MGVPHKCDGCRLIKPDCIVQFYPSELWYCSECKHKIVYGRKPKPATSYQIAVNLLDRAAVQNIY